MIKSLKIALAAAATFGGVALSNGSASAMPLGGLDPAVATSADLHSSVQDVRWVCGPFRCHWRPNYYGYYGGYYGPRPFVYGPRFGYWHRWHHHYW